ncbi:hypothetical protein LCGC14_1722760 [marine sediment metagenome]|uniref:Uncharacterized protein n=1 Tax=marine sediment metagenome TaxID=412755 RepID=A0A0F9KBN4_9ZZZZ
MSKTKEAVSGVDNAFGPNNLHYEIVEGILIIRIDLGRQLPAPTANGNISIATTRGNQTIDGLGTKLGVNVYRKVEKPVTVVTAAE